MNHCLKLKTSHTPNVQQQSEFSHFPLSQCQQPSFKLRMCLPALPWLLPPVLHPFYVKAHPASSRFPHSPGSLDTRAWVPPVPPDPPALAPYPCVLQSSSLTPYSQWPTASSQPFTPCFLHLQHSPERTTGPASFSLRWSPRLMAPALPLLLMHAISHHLL